MAADKRLGQIRGRFSAWGSGRLWSKAWFSDLERVSRKIFSTEAKYLVVAVSDGI